MPIRELLRTRGILHVRELQNEFGSRATAQQRLCVCVCVRACGWVGAFKHAPTAVDATRKVSLQHLSKHCPHLHSRVVQCGTCAQCVLTTPCRVTQ